MRAQFINSGTDAVVVSIEVQGSAPYLLPVAPGAVLTLPAESVLSMVGPEHRD